MLTNTIITSFFLLHFKLSTKFYVDWKNYNNPLTIIEGYFSECKVLLTICIHHIVNIFNNHISICKEQIIHHLLISSQPNKITNRKKNELKRTIP